MPEVGQICSILIPTYTCLAKGRQNKFCLGNPETLRLRLKIDPTTVLCTYFDQLSLIVIFQYVCIAHKSEANTNYTR